MHSTLNGPYPSDNVRVGGWHCLPRTPEKEIQHMMLAHLRLDVDEEKATPHRCRNCGRTFYPMAVQDCCSTRCVIEYLKRQGRRSHVAK